MRIVAKDILVDFYCRHAQAEGPIKSWLAEAEKASWRISQDIKNRYSSVSFLPGNRVVFNMGGNKFRLDVKVDYPTGVILIKRVGTHKEYDKWSFD